MRAAHEASISPSPMRLSTDGSGSVVLWRDAASWDRFVLTAPDGTIAHRWAWTQIIAHAYNHRVLPLAAVRDGVLVGVLPLTMVSSPLFGAAMVSMPYIDTGGVCTSDGWAESALVQRALAEARERAARLELRHRDARDIGLPASLHKVTMTMRLDDGEAAVWARVKPNRRSQVRKALRHGLAAMVTGSDGLPEFHRVMSVNMRDLGTPMHRRRFFHAIANAFRDDARIVLVRSDREVLAAGLVLFHAGRAVLPWSSCLHSARSTGANQLLYWSVAEHALTRGCHTLDLGRSTPGSGTYEAKREWGALPAQLYWHQDPVHDGATADDAGSGLMRTAVQMWRHVPVPIATTLGGLIRGGLPQ
jgi:FemAB-related protein (PEP-CTERM system-associated)